MPFSGAVLCAGDGECRCGVGLLKQVPGRLPTRHDDGDEGAHGDRRLTSLAPDATCAGALPCLRASAEDARPRDRRHCGKQVRCTMYGGPALRAARLRSHAAACIRCPLRRRAAFCEKPKWAAAGLLTHMPAWQRLVLQAEGSRTGCGCPQSVYKREKALARSRVMRLRRNVRYKARRFCGNPMDGSGGGLAHPILRLAKAKALRTMRNRPAHFLPHSRFCAMK